MGIFKESSNSKPHPEHFGVGSSFSESSFGVAVVIDVDNNYVGVICKSKLLKLKIKVSDINHLTFDEWKDLFNEFRIEMGNLCLTSSDCDIDTDFSNRLKK